MYTRDDLIDAILRHLPPPRASQDAATHSPSAQSPAGAPRCRPFLTEYEIKKALTPGARHLTIPRDAILSPLAQEWLALKGIEVLRG